MASTSCSFFGEPSVWRNSLSTVDLLDNWSPSMLCLSKSATRNSLLASTDGSMGTATPPLTERRRARGAGNSAWCGVVQGYRVGGDAGWGSQEAPATSTSRSSFEEEEDGLPFSSTDTEFGAAVGTYGRFDGECERSGGGRCVVITAGFRLKIHSCRAAAAGGTRAPENPRSKRQVAPAAERMYSAEQPLPLLAYPQGTSARTPRC